MVPTDMAPARLYPKIRHDMTSSWRDALEIQPAGCQILQPAAQLELSIRCECFNINCMGNMVEKQGVLRVSGGLGRAAMVLSALPSPHFTCRTELILSPAAPKIHFQRPADDRFPLAATCSGRDSLQYCAML